MTAGPLVGYSFQTEPPPTARGGAITDGIYDLIRIVNHEQASGDWSSNNSPAYRWAMRFTTEERSPNHTEGSLVTSIDLPPARKCDTGRFATVETKLRTMSSTRREMNAEDYVATPDGLMLVTKGTTYVFKRR